MRCPTFSFYNQTLLSTGSNPKGTQRNEIWLVDVFYFAEFEKLKYVHQNIFRFSMGTALSSEKADSVITHLFKVMVIIGIPTHIKTDNGQSYVSKKMKHFCLL